MPSWLYAEFAMCQVVPQSYTIMQKTVLSQTEWVFLVPFRLYINNNMLVTFFATDFQAFFMAIKVMIEIPELT